MITAIICMLICLFSGFLYNAVAQITVDIGVVVSDQTVSALPGKYAKALLEELTGWGKVTTIVLHGGCVFEFKGAFPKGSEGSGIYNLESDGDGFEGHLNLEKVDHIAYQDKLHRGMQSYAFVFSDASKGCMFKVFVGRDEQGELLSHQVKRFKEIQANNQL